MSGPHPSRLALDVVALGEGDAATAEHAKGCALCAAHLAKVQIDLPLPQWVKDLEQGVRRPKAWWRPFVALAALSAAAASLWVVTEVRGPELQAKGVGAPSVQVWVNRSSKVEPWAGRPLHADDAIRFEVHPGRYQHLTVVELQSGRLFRVLHSAPVPRDGLSPAWAVDAQGDHEEVAVLLSMAPLSQDELEGALAGAPNVWLTRWSFPKEVR